MSKQKVLDTLALLMASADPADVPRYQQALAVVQGLPEGSPLLVLYHPTSDPGDPDNEEKWRSLWLPPEELPQ